MVILKYCETRKVKAGKSELGGSHFLVAHWQDDSSWHWTVDNLVYKNLNNCLYDSVRISTMRENIYFMNCKYRKKNSLEWQ